MASYQGAGDSSVDLGRTMQMLKMSRKGYQVQADKKKKETELEKEKLLSSMEYLKQELDDLDVKEQDLAGRYEKEEERGISAVEESLSALLSQKRRWISLWRRL